jgi:hypothetical protein
MGTTFTAAIKRSMGKISPKGMRRAVQDAEDAIIEQEESSRGYESLPRESPLGLRRDSIPHRSNQRRNGIYYGRRRYTWDYTIN